MAEGTVRWFNSQKGFGFIAEDGGGDVYVHLTAITGGGSVGEGQRVTFDTESDERGKKAVNVQPKNEFVDVPPPTTDRTKRVGGGGGGGGSRGGGFRGAGGGSRGGGFRGGSRKGGGGRNKRF